MRFKSVLGAFLFILLACFVALVVFIQTKSFGALVTKVVTDLSEKKLQTEVKVKSFTLSVFPPGLELNKVRVKKKFNEEKHFQAEFGKIGFYISLIEIEEKKLTLGEIRIADSSIHYTYPETNEELHEIDQKLIKDIFDLSDNAPIGIDTVLLENTRIYANRDLLEAKRFKIFKKPDSFITRFQVANIYPNPESSFKIDEIWGDAEISRTDINLYRVKAQHDVHSVLLKGKISNYSKLKDSSFNINGEAQVYLKNITKEFKVPDFLEVKNGLSKIGFKLNYDKRDLTGDADLYIEDLKSNIIYANEVRSFLTLQNEKLSINEFKLNYKDQKLELLNPVVVYNTKSSTYLNHPIYVSLQNFSISNGIRVLGPSFKSLKGNLNGDLIFEYRKKNLYFTPQSPFNIKNLGLVVGPSSDPFSVLMIKEAALTNSQFTVIDNEFRMHSSVTLPSSRLEVTGYANKERVQFNVPDAKVDLEDFGNISNLDIKGAGELSIYVSGPVKKTNINIRGSTTGFEILGYKLGRTDKDLTIDLDNSEVLINKMEAFIGKTNLSGNGTVNYKNRDIALGISTTETTSGDLAYILNPIFKDLNFLPEDLDYKAKIEVDIFGKTTLEDIKLRSRVNFSDLSFYGEEINAGSLDIKLNNQVLSFLNLDAKKSRGNIIGDFTYGLKNKSLKANYLWDKIPFQSFNIVKRAGINIDSNLSGSFAASGSVDDYLLKLRTAATQTSNQAFKYDDSHINLNITKKRLSGKLNLLGNTINSELDLSLKAGVASRLKLALNSDDIKPLMVAVFGQNLVSEEFTGRISFVGDTTFQDGFKNLELTGHLKRLVFTHQDYKVNYFSDKPEFLVENSRIKLWDLNIKEPDLFVVTNGEGEFGKRVTLNQKLHFNSKIFEILLAPVLSAEGFLRNSLVIKGDGTEFDFNINAEASNLNLSIDQLPIPVNNLSYTLELSERRLMIKEISTAIDNGSFSLKGDVFFDNFQPDVNIKFVFDKAEIPILGGSYANITGEGIILGNKLPYNVGGDITINKAQIVNELNEFSSKSSAFSQIRFLPKNRESIWGKLFNLNLNIEADNPIRVTNSLMDVALKGEVRVFGNPSRPRGEGRLYIPVNTSRIFFKNNEYVINSADINFNPKKELTNPDFDIQAVTYISTYKVFPKAYGDLERFNFDLTSDPALPRNSILSLIAFGYTDEIQSSLESKDQQSLTQVGVGSFVFDRFKISDILNKQFGLQINLGTVIEQSGTDSLLSGRSQEGSFGQGGGALGRTRSATKIELKKRLDEAVTLSVSSTMGGSIGQRQSMNLTYGLTRKVQLEGVYELRTNEEGQEDVIDNSIGGDLKFRWTFK